MPNKSVLCPLNNAPTCVGFLCIFYGVPFLLTLTLELHFFTFIVFLCDVSSVSYYLICIDQSTVVRFRQSASKLKFGHLKLVHKHKSQVVNASIPILCIRVWEQPDPVD